MLLYISYNSGSHNVIYIKYNNDNPTVIVNQL